jgi:hypothetical protein
MDTSMKKPIMNSNGEVKSIWVKKGVDAKRKQFYSDSPGYYQLYESSNSQSSVWAFAWVLDSNNSLPDTLSVCNDEEINKLQHKVNNI